MKEKLREVVYIIYGQKDYSIKFRKSDQYPVYKAGISDHLEDVNTNSHTHLKHNINDLEHFIIIIMHKFVVNFTCSTCDVTDCARARAHNQLVSCTDVYTCDQ